MSNFLKRLISSIFLFCFFLAAIFTTSFIFKVFFALIAFFMCYEWQGLVLPKVSKPLKIFASLSIIGIFLFANQIGLLVYLWPPLAILAIFYYLMVRQEVQLKDYVIYMIGVVYIYIFYYSLFALKFDFPMGKWLLLLAFVTVWSVDTGAYFTGKIFKGPKIAPAVSPSKTWSGLVGAMVLSTFVFYVFANYFGLNLDATLYYVIPVLAILGQVGDFLQSFFKRRAGVKDSGAVIPGHGGVLDRFDGALLVIPAFYGLLYFYS